VPSASPKRFRICPYFPVNTLDTIPSLHAVAHGKPGLDSVGGRVRAADVHGERQPALVHQGTAEGFSHRAHPLWIASQDRRLVDREIPCKKEIQATFHGELGQPRRQGRALTDRVPPPPSLGPPMGKLGLIGKKACCDPTEDPGTHGNPFCFEGATCCGDGSWACNAGDGSPTCDVISQVCEPEPCHDPATGAAICCPVDGERKQIGETFPADDDCNVCTCLPSEQVVCTLRACISRGS
jgi:hypothetical protein